MKCFFYKEKGQGLPEVLVHEPSASAIEEAGWIFALTSEPTGGRNDGATREEEEFCELTVIDSEHRFMCAIEVTSKRTVCDTRRTWKTTGDEFGS